ncbi:DUF5696 domain-containing protein [Lachnoclostridium sp.]|uniref:DUF5696 domain-containing protein n=1 Tax=Lachnoclostridium sp. TaxID=2028282 RepID=UPI0028A15557|nr:DUF5696 domain-containing protein [Lachnoclostridium sp.]
MRGEQLEKCLGYGKYIQFFSAKYGMLKNCTLMIICSCILLGLTGCTKVTVKLEDVILYGYEPTNEAEILVENEFLEMHFLPDTAQFYVVEKETGDTWYSNPQDVLEDLIADSVGKQILNSQITLQYSNGAGNTATLNSCGYSVDKGLYTYEKTETGIKVMYTLGNIERTYLIPVSVPESRMSIFLEKMDKSAKRKIDEYYRCYDLSKLRATDNRAELIKKYPDLENERVYVLRDTVQSYLKVQIEDLFASLGYTEADYEQDIARYEKQEKIDKPIFNVTIEYCLDGKDFIVNVPYEEIRYKKEYPITQLRILPYFGAGSTSEEGFLFVPDGSGAIINFNNGKYTQNAYYNSVFGWDSGLSRSAIINDNKAIYPVFGISKNGSSFLCVVENGSSYANIEADVSGRLNGYNFVLAQYAMIHGETMDISAKSDKTVILYENSLPKETITQRYIFCNKPDYTSMAIAYREYLMEQYPMLLKQESNSLPVVVELLGAIDKVQKKFGLPIDLPLALTTYKEAAQIVEELDSFGWEQVSYRYNGWFNGGIKHSVPSKVKLISELGNKKSFNQLVSLIKEKEGELYLNGEFQLMTENSWFDGFSLNSDAARYINRKRIEIYPYSPIWYGERKRSGILYYLARPQYTKELLSSYEEKVNDFGVNGISLGSIGQSLGADYNEKKLVSREQSMGMQVDEMRRMKENENKILITQGNSYAAPYADIIVDLPLRSQQIAILDAEIPFYPIALHGLVTYTGQAINLAEDYQTNLLKSIENGAAPYFIFMKASTEKLQESDYMRYFGTDYSLWKEDANGIYHKWKEDFSTIYDKFITGHEILTKGVTVTTYEDGTRAVVNYNEIPYVYKSHTIAPQDYLVLKGGE